MGRDCVCGLAAAELVAGSGRAGRLGRAHRTLRWLALVLAAVLLV